MSSSHDNLGPDPSMDEILSSIRRILREDEGIANGDTRDHEPAAADDDKPEADAADETVREENPNGVFVLDPSMLVSETHQRPAPKPAPAEPAPPRQSQPQAAIPPQMAPAGPAPDPAMALARGGPTLDDIVRDEIRPLLHAWLDAHLPALIDRIAREEIARLIDQSKQAQRP